MPKREQDPLGPQGIRVADQERLRSWGPDVGAWRVAVRARAGTAFSTGRSTGPDLWRRRQDPRDPNLGSRDPDRVCVGVWVVVWVCVLRESARVCVRAVVRACVCVWVCVRAGVCVRVGVWVCVCAQKPYS